MNKLNKLACNLELAARIVRDPSLKWEVFDNHTWGQATRDVVSLVADNFDIRLKPKSKYVSWTLQTRPAAVVYVRRKEDNIAEGLILCWHHFHVTVGGYGSVSYDRLFNEYTLLDGSPCGTLSS